MKDVKTRLQRVRQTMQQKQIDLFLVTIEENRFYLSGFSGEDTQFDESAGALLITRDDLVLATDSRFDTQARLEAPLYKVAIYRNGLAKLLPEQIAAPDVKRIGFESVRMSCHQFESCRNELASSRSDIEWVPCTDLVETLRQCKTDDEIETTRRALAIAEDAFCQVVRTLKPGMSERQIAWQMEKTMRQAGAQCLSFAPIIAAGANAALPHAIPTDRPIQAGEPVLFDWGARLNHYCSDTSRTVILGPPDDTFKKVFGTVHTAQQKAIDAIRAGQSTAMIDAIARDYIADQGFKDKFGHGLGHGTGLAVHEAPRLSPLKDTLLEAGMIVTVEPGIYLPDWGGVRIENQVVVGETGPMVLNQLPVEYDISRY